MMNRQPLAPDATKLRCLIGLGNMGSQYEKTRHNAGFWLLDQITEGLSSFQWKEEKKFFGFVGQWKAPSGEVVYFIKPTTFMNLSGKSLHSLLQFFQISIQSVVIAYDDLHIPLGKTKLSLSHSDTGHGGIRSILSHYPRADLYRIRIGIGPFSSGDSASRFVLTQPTPEEKKQILNSTNRVATEIQLLMHRDITMAHFWTSALNRLNRSS